MKGLEQAQHIGIGHQVIPLQRKFARLFVEGAGHVAHQGSNLFGELYLVILLGLIADPTHLVLEDSPDLTVEFDGLGIVVNPLVTQQFIAILDPTPALVRLGGRDGHGDVVGHVPGVKLPDRGKARLECGDPLGQLLGIEELTLLLQVVGPHPQDVHDQAAERAHGDRGEGERRRRVLQGHLGHDHTGLHAELGQGCQETARRPYQGQADDRTHAPY